MFWRVGDCSGLALFILLEGCGRALLARGELSGQVGCRLSIDAIGLAG